MMPKKDEKNSIEKRMRNLETEKQLLDGERLRLEQELHSLRNEIDRLREPPLEVAVVVDTVDNDKGRYVVLISSGLSLVVNASKKAKEYNIKPGSVVAVNRRTYAIMDILLLNLKLIKKYKHFFIPQRLKEENLKLDKYPLSKIRRTVRRHGEILRVLGGESKDLVYNEASLKDQLDGLREETKYLLKTPLIIGIILEVLDEEEGKCVVLSSEGPLYVVNTINKLEINQKLEIGMVVALNRRTFAIMEILSISLENLKALKQFL